MAARCPKSMIRKYVFKFTFDVKVLPKRERKSQGKRMRSGWKNCGAPWTYDVNPDQTCLPCVKK